MTSVDPKKEYILALSMTEGIKYGALATAIGGGVTLYGIKYVPWFNKSFSTSAKTSIPVMAGVFTWSLMYELTMNSAHRYPERWGIDDPTNLPDPSQVARKSEKRLPFHHWVANTLYDNSFQFVGLAGVGLAAKIFRDQLQLQHITVSQRIMHSRVFAQAGILSILLPTMAFREFMERRGGHYLD
eukprot:gene10933-22825_t